jgi:predicted nuclease of predicted toxin-antitoxin system
MHACTGIGVSEKLKQMGFDSEDIDVIKRAKKENRIVVTNDKDFGWLAAIYKSPGLILLRLKEETIEMKIRVIHNVISKHQDPIYGSITIDRYEDILQHQIGKSSPKHTSPEYAFHLTNAAS